MKGGKEGRKRKSSGGVGRQSSGRGKPKPARDQRPADGAPKKGSRKKPHYGGVSTSSDE